MAITRWLGVVATAFALSATSTTLVRAVQLGQWHPRYATGAEMSICTDSTDCARNVMYINFDTLEENDYGEAATRTIKHVADFNTSDAFTYDDNYVEFNGSAVVSAGQRFAAAIPNDGVTPAYNLPAASSDPVFACNVSQTMAGAQMSLPGFSLTAPPNSMTIELSVAKWMLVSNTSRLHLMLSIDLSLVSAWPPFEQPINMYIGEGVYRYQLSPTVYFDLPSQALDANGTRVIAFGSIGMRDELFVLHLDVVTSSFVKYAFVLNAGDPVLLPLPSPMPNPMPAPTPMPMPMPIPTSTPARMPAPTPMPMPMPIPTSTPTRMPAPTPKVDVTFPTAVNVLPGGFEFCAAANCNIRDGSFSMVLNKFGHGATADATSSSVTFANVPTDLAASANELRFTTPEDSDDDSRNAIHAMYVAIPKTSGRVTFVDERAFVNTIDSEMIYMALHLEHMANATNFADDTGGSDSIDLPVGDLQLSIALNIPASMNTPFTLARPALTFLLAVFEKSKTVTNVTVVRDVDATVVVLGDAMRLAFVAYVDVDGSSTPLTVLAKPHTTGELAGLIELTLLVDSITSIAAPSNLYFDAAISAAALDSGAANATNTTDWTTAAPPVVPGFEGVKTQLLALAHGEFGLCLDATSCGQSSVKLGFSGLGSTGSSGDANLGRFANAQAFEFSDPVLMSEIVDGQNVTKWSTGFRAFVPQSQLRPPMPYDPIALQSGLPEFAVQVDQYLTPGLSSNGDQQIRVPSGGLKFAFNLTKWTFASSTDSLVLNITLANATGAVVPGASIASAFSETKDVTTGLSRTTVNVSDSLATIAEFPLFAVVDGVTTAIDIAAIWDPRVGVVVSMRFPYFKDSLYYDPVLSSSLLSDSLPTPIPTTTPAPSRGIDMNFRKQHAMTSTSTSSGRIAVVLLAFLGFVVVLSVMRCVKRVSFKGLDWSKIIP